MNNPLSPYQSFGNPEAVVAQQRTYLVRVYGWMTVGLVFTALAAIYTLSQDYLIKAILTNSWLFFSLIIGELALVLVLNGALSRLSPPIATAMFLLYATLNGVTLSFILLIYTAASVGETFLITAGMFGVMSAYGYFTKRDLTSLGNILMMALVGVILASVFNIFFNVAAIYWIVTFLGIAVFVGLVAYDTQKIKRIMGATADGTEANYKAAIIGALILYLDFVNLFLLLLRLFGKRR
jgi:FtsH-binding integral membrane protein